MNRRKFLSALKRLGIPAILLYPFYHFINTAQIRPPVEIRIRKAIKTGEFLMEPALIVFHVNEGMIAVSRKCTHLGCTLNYDAVQKEFICPCHQSRFDWNGRYISGPAKKNLAVFEVEKLKDEEGILVRIPRGSH